MNVISMISHRMTDVTMTSVSMARKDEAESLVFYEKLIGDGTAYIDTGAVLTPDKNISIEYSNTNNGIGFLYGARRISNGEGMLYLFAGYGGLNHYVSCWSPVFQTISVDGARRKLYTLYENGKIVLYRYNCTTHETAQITNPLSIGISQNLGVPLLLLASNLSNSAAIDSRILKAEIYDFKIEQDGTELLHLKPCKYNGVCGMWDIVNGVFYGNANTSGEFSVEGETTI